MLSRCRVLVVEDEPALAEHLRDILTEAEGVVVGPAASVSDAKRLVAHGAIDAAILDLNLSDAAVTPVLEALTARGVPAVVYSGGEVPPSLRKRHPTLIALSKPVRPARLIAELRRVMGQLP
jgi:DNA-binding NtrC family response regulator